jgi:hypothetical protein
LYSEYRGVLIMPVNSPNMSLPVPTIGVDQGPNWELDINSCLAIIDQHNHASGNGVPVGPSGLNINTFLSFQNNPLTSLGYAQFTTNNSPLSGSLLGIIYRAGVDLYYNDGNGNQIQLTESGGVAGSPGSIGGLVSPASATYVSSTPAFVFQSNVSTAANLDGGSLVLRNITANSHGVTLNPPNALAADYSITLPTGLPGSTQLLQMDSSGSISASNTIVNPVTIGVGGTTLSNGSNNTLVLSTGLQIDGAGSPYLTGFSSNSLALFDDSFSNGFPLVVSAAPVSDGLMIVRGTVDGFSGLKTGGEGFTSSRVSTGRYNLVWSNSFLTNDVTLVVTYTNASGGAPVVGSLSSTGGTVFSFNFSGSLTDNDFNFIAIAQRG